MAFLIAAIGFEFCFDDSYDGLLSKLSIGQFSPFSLFDWHFLGLLWIKEPLKFIQNLFFDIDVFYTFYIFCTLLAAFYLFYTFGKITTINSTLKLIIYISFLLIIVDSLIFVTHTRFATLFAGLALFNLAYFSSQSRVKIVVHCLIFLFGFLVRPESGVGALLFVIPGLFFHGQPILRLLKVSILPLSCAILFFVTLESYKLFTDRLEILIEPDIEYAMSTDKFLPLKKNATKIDSVRYEFARNGFFIDTSFVDDKFLRTIISNTKTIDFKTYIKSVNHVILFYISYSIVSFALFFILLSHLFSYQLDLFCKVLAYNIFIFLILTLLDYQVNIADRHFSPLILLTMLLSAMFYEKIETFKQMQFANALFVFLLFFPINYTWRYIRQNNKQVIYNVKNNVVSLNKFEEKTQGRNVIVTVSGFKLFDKPYSFFKTNRTKNNYFIYDLSTYSIVPRYTSYLSSKCNCNAAVPLEFFKWLDTTNGIILIDEKRAIILEKYIKFRYNKEITFVDLIELNKLFDKEMWPDLRAKIIVFD